MLIEPIQDLLQTLKNDFSKLDIVTKSLKEILPCNPSKIVEYWPPIMGTFLSEMDSNDKEILKKIVILSCILENWDDFSHDNYSPTVLTQYEVIFNRILANCENDKGWGEQKLDVYWKELAMVRKLMFPAGAQIVEQYSGFSIKQALHLNNISTLRFLKFLALNGSSKGYYQIHTYTPELSQFNEKGWHECYLRLATMLKINTDIKGVFGISWFYDPQLTGISPRLTYLQSTPLLGGAKSFYLGNDNTGNAISTSKSRIKLYKDGKYIPKSYLLIWPRKELIAWADEQNQAKNRDNL